MVDLGIGALKGSITALATPFRDGRIDEGAVVARSAAAPPGW